MERKPITKADVMEKLEVMEGVMANMEALRLTAGGTDIIVTPEHVMYMTEVAMVEALKRLRAVHALLANIQDDTIPLALRPSEEAKGDASDLDYGPVSPRIAELNAAVIQNAMDLKAAKQTAGAS